MRAEASLCAAFDRCRIGHQPAALAETIKDGKTDFVLTSLDESFLEAVCRRRLS